MQEDIRRHTPAGAVACHHTGGTGETVSGAQNFSGKRPRSQADLERWAAEQVRRWGKVERGDYDFARWSDGASARWLRAGVVYENARDAWRLRCLLVLTRRCLEEGVRGMEFLGLSFEGLRYRDALQHLGGWFGWLRGFTQELTENISFGELGEDRVARSLEELPRYFLAPSAVSLAMPVGLVEPRILWPWDLVARDVGGVSGVVNMPVQFRFGDFTNAQIMEQMTRFLALHRPSDCPEPQHRGKGKASEVLALLDALSVGRICRRYPRARDLSRRIREVGSVTGYCGCALYAKAHRRGFRAGEYKPELSGGEKTEIARARKRASVFFCNLFPWEKQSDLAAEEEVT